MALYGTDDELDPLVADKTALSLAKPLDKQRALANREIQRALRRQNLTDAAIATLGAEALAQLKDAENFGTLAIFFAGFLAPEFQAVAKTMRTRMEEALEQLPAVDDDPGGEQYFCSTIGLG